MHSQRLVLLLLLGKCKVAGSIPVRDTILLPRCGSHLYKTFAVFDLFKSPQTSAAASGHYFDVNDAYSDRIK